MRRGSIGDGRRQSLRHEGDLSHFPIRKSTRALALATRMMAFLAPADVAAPPEEKQQ